MEPWNQDVRGAPVLELVNSDATTIRVEAGPGTGKTFGLVRRVQRILHPHGLNLDGKDVLIVAFNRVIANKLRADVELRLTESAHNGTPNISTVHALCLQVIGAPLRLLLPHEREAMLYDVPQLFPAMRELYHTHSGLDQALRDHEAGLQEHLALWQAVTHWLKRHRATLISDLPRLLLDKIHAGDYEGSSYEHVIVDEFQDLTRAEQLLFMKLRRAGGSLVALGDSKQSIYRFRGNDREGLGKLQELDPGASITDIPLLECQRCPAPMVTAANHLMSLYPPAMTCTSTSPANLHVLYWRTPQAEARGLAKHVVENVKAHRGERHLVMVTRRRFGYWLRDAMKKVDPSVTVDLSFSESLLETWPVREAFLFFCLIVDPDPPTWRAWLAYQALDANGHFKAPARNADAYLRLLERTGDDITAQAIADLTKEPRSRQRGQGGTNLWDRARRFLKLKDEFRIEDETPQDILARVFDPERWPDNASHEARLDMELVRAKCLSMVEETQDADPAALLKRIARRLRHMIATREPFEVGEACDVQVTTLWGAKGVTADHVYILGLCEQAIPGERRDEYPGTDDDFVEEQRRLFYVSITRSRRTLVLSRAQKIRPGDAMRLGLSVTSTRERWLPLNMCPFLRDISGLLPKAEPGDKWQGCKV